ncbi:SDR family oxidoreductase [Candidatus Pelagibacter sp.]|nr:SDR family oxidoreductase [Candidatus Pelagibacter sp.]
MSKLNKIFITGGAGYVGSRLVPFFLEKNYKVCVYDTMYFGSEHLKNHANLTLIKGDIRDTKKIEISCKGYDIFLHLACISNDSSFELNEELSKTINYDCFEPMVSSAKNVGIKRFIYASSSSVYGVSEEKDVKEDHKLLPLTLYNKFKGMCEPQLLKYTDDNFTGVIFRPATVYGCSNRMRFDLSVNILTNHAIKNKKILVFGGSQLRPNLHIEDYCEAVKLLCECDKSKIENEIFNVGYQNLSILDIAKKVKKIVESKFEDIDNIEIELQESNDIRSYHINSDKIYDKLEFKPQKTIEYGIGEICDAFKNGLFKDSFDNINYYNVKKLKFLDAK